MQFEKTRIKELSKLYPDLADHLMNIHDNIIDLMDPFQYKQYYTKAMQGSYSIKYVLPALFPDDPKLDYLYRNTRLDTPSASRHNFGTLYGKDGRLFFDLNIQIRFIK